MSLKLLLLCAILATVSCLKLTDDILLGNVPIGGPLKKAEPHAALLDDLKNLDENSMNQLFDEFKKQYNKVYHSKEDELKRRSIFIEHAKMVLDNNVKAIRGESTYLMTLHSLSDSPIKEILQQPAGLWPNSNSSVVKSDDSDYVNSWAFDKYRQHHQVGPIQNQGACGSCVYFAAAATIESYWTIRGHRMEPLSPQQLMDCSFNIKRGNNGCHYGTFNPTFDYIKAHGITSMQNYPYKARLEKCDFNREKHPVAHINSWHYVMPQGNENALMQSVEHHGPTAVMIHFPTQLAHYKSGIYGGVCNTESHAVLAVGYGWDDHLKENYWILKNQWGLGFGEHGYFKLIRNHGNICGVASYAVYVQ